MALISNEGNVGVTSTILYECKPQNVCAINYIRFSNSVTNYDVTLQKYVSSTTATVDIYSVSLNHGDTITYDMVYILHPGDQITAIQKTITGSGFRKQCCNGKIRIEIIR